MSECLRILGFVLGYEGKFFKSGLRMRGGSNSGRNLTFLFNVDEEGKGRTGG